MALRLTALIESLSGMLFVHTVLSVLAVAHATPRFRKTLSFGPVLPHARFEIEPVKTLRAGSSHGPMTVAHDFLASMGHTPVDLSNAPQSAYIIRNDSYLDKNTRVTHVFVEQYIGGVQVDNGNINLNIKDGRVLSYGDSVS